MNTRRPGIDDYFFVLKARSGRYRACADLSPSRGGAHRYCRDAVTADKAIKLLDCLRRELAARSGPVMPVVEEWYRGELCDASVFGGCHRKANR